MVRIKDEDVLGYDIGELEVCCDCASDAEADNANLDEIITVGEVESTDGRIFCDRCRAEITVT